MKYYKERNGGPYIEMIPEADILLGLRCISVSKTSIWTTLRLQGLRLGNAGRNSSLPVAFKPTLAKRGGRNGWLLLRACHSKHDCQSCGPRFEAQLTIIIHWIAVRSYALSSTSLT